MQQLPLLPVANSAPEQNKPMGETPNRSSSDEFGQEMKRANAAVTRDVRENERDDSVIEQAGQSRLIGKEADTFDQQRAEPHVSEKSGSMLPRPTEEGSQEYTNPSATSFEESVLVAGDVIGLGVSNDLGIKRGSDQTNPYFPEGRSAIAVGVLDALRQAGIPAGAIGNAGKATGDGAAAPGLSNLAPDNVGAAAPLGAAARKHGDTTPSAAAGAVLAGAAGSVESEALERFSQVPANGNKPVVAAATSTGADRVSSGHEMASDFRAIQANPGRSKDGSSGGSVQVNRDSVEGLLDSSSVVRGFSTTSSAAAPRANNDFLQSFSPDIDLSSKVQVDVIKAANIAVDSNIDIKIEGGAVRMPDGSVDKPNTTTGSRPYVSSLPMPVDSSEWANQLSQKLAWLGARNIQSAELHLNPADLGPIEVRIQIGADQSSINFSSQNATVRELLEANIHRLRDMMSDQNLSQQSSQGDARKHEHAGAEHEQRKNAQGASGAQVGDASLRQTSDENQARSNPDSIVDAYI